jgi:hypothetical protein
MAGSRSSGCHSINGRVAGILLGVFSASILTCPGIPRYVDANGTNAIPPYLSWPTAASNIQQAADVSVAGDILWVTNGVYPPISITDGIQIRGVNGAANTSIDGSGYDSRCVYLNHSNAVIDGFTIRSGSVRKVGGEDREYGGGVYCENGIVRNCRIQNNTAYYYSKYSFESGGGAGVCLSGGLMENCIIISNIGYGVTGVGVLLRGGELRECVISHNTTGDPYYPTYGGGVSPTRGVVKNCVIAKNISGVQGSGGQFFNSVICSNETLNYSVPTGALAFCLSSPLPPGIGNMSNEPAFVSWDSEDFHLQPGSPCIDVGTSLESATQDLDGVVRPLDGNGDGYAVADLGVYEYRAAAQGLTNGGVSPSLGMTNTKFTFTVNYRGDVAAATNTLVMDGVTSAMTRIYGGDTNGIYAYSGYLSNGDHSFSFQAADVTGGEYRLPAAGDFNGPFVSSLATLSNGSAFPATAD